MVFSNLGWKTTLYYALKTPCYFALDDCAEKLQGNVNHPRFIASKQRFLHNLEIRNTVCVPSRIKIAKNPFILHNFIKFVGILLIVLKSMHISLLLTIFNGFSWPTKIMASPFNTYLSFCLLISFFRNSRSRIPWAFLRWISRRKITLLQRQHVFSGRWNISKGIKLEFPWRGINQLWAFFTASFIHRKWYLRLY